MSNRLSTGADLTKCHLTRGRHDYPMAMLTRGRHDYPMAMCRSDLNSSGLGVLFLSFIDA